MFRQLCVTLYYFIMLDHLSQPCCAFTSNEIETVCSSANSAFPYCTCSKPVSKVDCSAQDRKSVPLIFPIGTRIINLKMNDITTVKSKDFRDLEMLLTLDLSNNAIENIENGAFDRLYRLVNLSLSSNRLQIIDNYFFLHLASLEVIELNNNRVESVKGDAFFTLPAIKKINLTNNDLQCGCETRKLMQWFREKTGVTLDATCVNVKAGTDILKVNHNNFACTGDNLFLSRQKCRFCTQLNNEECEQKSEEKKCSHTSNVCYSQFLYSTNGLKMWKRCETYNKCISISRQTNPSGCYKSEDSLNCVFCCIGNLCNAEEFGNLLQTVNFNVTFVTNIPLNPPYNDSSSAAFQTFESYTKGKLEQELRKEPGLGTFAILLLSLSGPNFTARFSVKCTTATRTKTETLYDYLYVTLKSTSKFKLEMENATIAKVEVTSTDVCPLQNVTTERGTYQWPSTAVGRFARTDCLVPMSGKYARRYCNSVDGMAQWKVVDDAECYSTSTTSPTTPFYTSPAVGDSDISTSLEQLANITITNANANNISTQLKTLSGKASSFTAENLHLTVSKLEELVRFKSNTSQSGRNANIARIISNVLETSANSLLASQQQSNTLTRLLKITHEFIDTMDLAEGHFSAVNPNCALFAFNVSEKNYKGITLHTDVLPGNRLNSSGVTVVEDVLNTNLLTTSAIIIPSTLAEEINDTSSLSRITFAVYRNANIFSFQVISRNQSKIDKGFVTAPNSLILSASIPNVEVNNLKNPIVLSFIHQHEKANMPRCSFWDVNNTWSTRGCFVNKSVEGRFTLCTCNHLTNFALLMDIYGTGNSTSKQHKTALSIISYVGCGISFLALLLTLTCYLISRKLRSTNPGKLLINLIIALTATNIIFIVGQQSYTFRDYVGCKVVGIVMHYFLLSAMTWMAVEAFFIYLAIVKVFNIYVTHFLLKSCLLGWGVPFVIIVITIGVNRSDNYGLQAGDICWLSPNAFYGAILGPISLIMIWNFTSFVLVTRSLCRPASQQLLTNSVHNDMSARVRRSISVFVLFGLTWTFAIFAINKAGLAFQYLFTIFNSFQGFFIFIFYCLLNKEMKTTWTRLMPWRFADYSTTSQSSKATDHELVRHPGEDNLQKTAM